MDKIEGIAHEFYDKSSDNINKAENNNNLGKLTRIR